MANKETRFLDFFAGDSNSRGGNRIAVKNLDADKQADLVVGAGTGAGSQVTTYLGKELASGNTGPTSSIWILASLEACLWDKSDEVTTPQCGTVRWDAFSIPKPKPSHKLATAGIDRHFQPDSWDSFRQ